MTKGQWHHLVVTHTRPKSVALSMFQKDSLVVHLDFKQVGSKRPHLRDFGNPGEEA